MPVLDSYTALIIPAVQEGGREKTPSTRKQKKKIMSTIFNTLS